VADLWLYSDFKPDSSVPCKELDAKGIQDKE